MEVTEGGISTEVSSLPPSLPSMLPANALYLIALTPFPMVTEVSALLEKASGSIEVTEGGISTEVSSLLRNAASPIVLTPFPMVTEVS